MSPARRAVARAVAVAFLSLLGATTAQGGEETVYKYRTAAGDIEYGTEVPADATLLGEVGRVDTDTDAATGPSGGGGDAAIGGADARSRALAATDPERILLELEDDPLVAGIVAAAVFLWALGVLLAMPPVFSTLALDLRGAMRMIGAIAAGWLTLAVAGLGVDWTSAAVGWSPRATFGELPLAVAGWSLYALVGVYAFGKRLGVRLGAAVVLTGLWLLLVAGFAACLWIFGVPVLVDLL